MTIGKLSLKPVGELVLEYQKRLKHYSPVEMISLKSLEALPKRLDAGDFLVALDEKGKSFDSRALAKWLENKKMDGTKSLVFLVGPGEGLPEAIKTKADLLLRLSDFTLQHELALVILMEQIYRASTILKGEPYHK